jgi:SH3-like domain-containing protein
MNSRILPCVLAAVVALLATGPVASAAAAPPEGVLWLPSAPPPPPPPAVSAAPRTSVHRLGGRPLPVVHAPATPPRRAPDRPPPHPVALPRPAPPAPKPPDVGSVTGLPLPRFATLRSSEVDLRAGPGFRYPIRWVYHRLGMPVEIEREFGVWREVLTPDGAHGWMHEATLTGRRDGIVIGARHALRAGDSADARAVAILEPGVVVRLLLCTPGAAWCRVQVAAFRGWLPRTDFWGTFPGEAVRGR